MLTASACCCCCTPGAGDLLVPEDLRFIGGTNGPVYLLCVMKGCSFACCGDQRSSGLIIRRPRTKSMKASRLFISMNDQQTELQTCSFGLPLSISACFIFFLGMAYFLMISGSVVAWKYFLLGCSFELCSREYCSIDLSR